jgi:hypothetical protein
MWTYWSLQTTDNGNAKVKEAFAGSNVFATYFLSFRCRCAVHLQFADEN